MIAGSTAALVTEASCLFCVSVIFNINRYSPL
jgi:hypothetical protein